MATSGGQLSWPLAVAGTGASRLQKRDNLKMNDNNLEGMTIIWKE